jgi:hypothetical protein
MEKEELAGAPGACAELFDYFLDLGPRIRCNGRHHQDD